MAKIDGKEAGISVVRSMFGAVPFAGGALNELFFDYRSRVKQNRVNEFCGLLSDFFLEHTDIDPESLKTEEFSDIFESVVRRVVLTKSKAKHLRFRDVLIQHIFEPTKSVENAETYLELIGALDETAIRILSDHNKFSNDYARLEPLVMTYDGRARHTRDLIDKRSAEYPKDENAIATLEAQMKEQLAEAEKIRQQINNGQEFRKAAFYGISDSEFTFYKQTLYAKGLLIDKGFGTFGGSQPFIRMWITEFGQEFIRFVATNEN